MPWENSKNYFDRISHLKMVQLINMHEMFFIGMEGLGERGGRYTKILALIFISSSLNL